MSKPHRLGGGNRPSHNKASWEYDLCNISVGIWRSRRSLKKLLILFNPKLLVLLVARTEEDVNRRAESRWERALQAANQLVDKRNPFFLPAELPEAHTVVALELRWPDIQGMDYTFPLHMDGRLVLEARTLTKRVFPSMRSAHQYYQEAARKALQSQTAQPTKLKPAPITVDAHSLPAQLIEDEAGAGSSASTPQGITARPKRTHRRVSYTALELDEHLEVTSAQPPGVLPLSRLRADPSEIASSSPATPQDTPTGQHGAAAHLQTPIVPCIVLPPPVHANGLDSHSIHSEAALQPTHQSLSPVDDSCASPDQAAPQPGATAWNRWLKSWVGAGGTHRPASASTHHGRQPQELQQGHCSQGASQSGLTSLQPSLHSLQQLTDGSRAATGYSDAGTTSTYSTAPTSMFSPESRMSLEALGSGTHSLHHHKHLGGTRFASATACGPPPSPAAHMLSPRIQPLSVRKSASAQDLPSSAVHDLLCPESPSHPSQGLALPPSTALHSKHRSSLDDTSISLAALARQLDASLSRSGNLVSDLVPSLLQVKARLLGEAGGSGTSSPRGRHSWGLGWRFKKGRTRGGDDNRAAGQGSDSASGLALINPDAVSAQYSGHTVILSFKDPLLPPMLSRFVKSDVRLLKLYESGLPSWAVFLPSYGLWYRPWLRQATWLLVTAVSCLSMAMGFYDLYKNVPVVRQAMAALSAQIFPPATQLFEWLEKHAQIRLSILLTYLFSKSPLFVTLMRFLRTCMTSMTQLIGPLTAAAQTALAPVISMCTYLGSSLYYLLQPVLALFTWLAANLSLLASSLGAGLSALLGPPAQALWAALQAVGQAGMLLVHLGKTVLWGPLYVCTQAWEALQVLGVQLGSNLQWLAAAGGALGRIIAGWGTAAKSAIPAAQATGKAVAAAASAARATPTPGAGSWSLFARMGQEAWGLLEFLRTTLYRCLKSLQAVLNGLMTLATTGYRHKTSIEMQTKQLLLPHQHYLPPAVQQLIQQPSASSASFAHIEDRALGEVSSMHRETVDTLEPVSPSGPPPAHHLRHDSVEADAFEADLHSAGDNLRRRHNARHPDPEGLSRSMEFGGGSGRISHGFQGMERLSAPAPGRKEAAHGSVAVSLSRMSGGSGPGGVQLQLQPLKGSGSDGGVPGRHMRRILSCPGMHDSA